MRDLRIVFMGTPEFAVPSLQVLVEAGYTLAGVVTAPDKPAGRGLKLKKSPVKQYAEKQGLSVLQPNNLKAAEFQEELRKLKANLFVVVAFRMLPRAVWSMPEYGTFNLHASLLPAYRGAAPIQWAIINGEKETGVTTFFLKHEIDTGHILLQEKEPIHASDTAGSLYERLMRKGSQLVLKTVQLIEREEEQLKSQKEGDYPHAPKIFKEHTRIDWNKPAEQVRNHIRGLAPFPTAWTTLDGKRLKVYFAELSTEELPAGQLHVQDKRLLVGTATQALALTDIQAEGKKRMPASEFIKGFKQEEAWLN